MQSSQPRRCSPRIKKQAIQTPYPAGKIDHILSSYQPQVLLKRLPEILNKDTHISKIDTYLKADQPKSKDIVPKPTRKPYGFMQSSFWVIMVVHVMVSGDLW